MAEYQFTGSDFVNLNKDVNHFAAEAGKGCVSRKMSFWPAEKN